MILPSNDYFIGNSAALDISSLLGASAGTQLSFSYSQGYDAGTEAEDFAFGPGGGLVGITTPADPPGGTVTMDPISLVTGPDPFAAFANLEPANFDTRRLILPAPHCHGNLDRRTRAGKLESCWQCRHGPIRIPPTSLTLPLDSFNLWSAMAWHRFGLSPLTKCDNWYTQHRFSTFP